MSTNVSFGTPMLTVRDNHGNNVRTIHYNRRFAGDKLDELIQRTVRGPRGLVQTQTDPRLFAADAPPNFRYAFSLSGQTLRTDSADVGRHSGLADVEGRPLWRRNALGVVTAWTYDALGRPLTISEASDSSPAAVREIWFYGEAEVDAKAHNLRGQCVRSYDMAGCLLRGGFMLTGGPTDETRRLLADAEGEADWSGPKESDWGHLLEDVDYKTGWNYDATGAWTKQTDAKGNTQHRAFDVVGHLTNYSLSLASGKRQAILSSIVYSATGQVQSESAGNGCVSAYSYEPETNRVTRRTVTRSAQRGRNATIQDLAFTYDPVGNVRSVIDATQTTSYQGNQKVAPTLAYDYDALYQLTSATGREVANLGQMGANLPTATIPLSSDDSSYANYRRTYTYDRGGNLTSIKHRGATNYRQDICVSGHSNHAILQNPLAPLSPTDVDSDTRFDAAGNQRSLLPNALQTLDWNGRNKLRRVSLVRRNGTNDDQEVYQYDADGSRVRKRLRRETNNTTRLIESIYLPGLTLRITSCANGKTLKVLESLQDISSQAGGFGAQCLHWDVKKSDELPNDMLRFGVGDSIGSIGIELDDQADLISREEYYPYGGTSIWTARSLIEADTKFIRYSRVERDVTGLYYYGHRFYQPWIGRWLSPDPASIVDGLNLYRMVRNNPIVFADVAGLAPEVGKYQIDIGFSAKLKIKMAEFISKPKIQEFDSKKNKFVDSNKFKLVEVNGSSGYLLGASEFRDELEHHHQLYDQYSRQHMSESMSDNINLGHDVAGYMLQSATDAVQDEDVPHSFDSRPLSHTVNTHFFAVLKKEDKDNIYTHRHMYGTSEVKVITNNQTNESEIIFNYTLAHPNTQIHRFTYSNDIANGETSNAGGVEFNIKGVGKYMTQKTLVKLSRRYNVTRVSTEAINVRSAAIAARFGAKTASSRSVRD